MITCPNCQTENPDDNKFCKKCGHTFSKELIQGIPLLKIIDSAKITKSDKNGLSRPEQEWLGKWFEIITNQQKKQNEILGRIGTWITFLGVLVIISIVVSVFR